MSAMSTTGLVANSALVESSFALACQPGNNPAPLAAMLASINAAREKSHGVACQSIEKLEKVFATTVETNAALQMQLSAQKMASKCASASHEALCTSLKERISLLKEKLNKLVETVIQLSIQHQALEAQKNAAAQTHAKLCEAKNMIRGMFKQLNF